MILFLSLIGQVIVSPDWRPEPLWKNLFEMPHIIDLSCSFILSLAVSLLAYRLFRVLTLTGTVLFVIFGTIIGTLGGLSSLAIYLTAFMIVFIATKYMQRKCIKLGKETDFRISSWTVFFTSFFSTVLAFWYFREIHTLRDCVGYEYIFTQGIYISLSSVAAYFTYVSVGYLEGRRIRWTITGLLLALLVSIFTYYTYLISRGLILTISYYFKQPEAIMIILYPALIAFAANIIREILRLRFDNQLLIAGIASFGCWLGYQGFEVVNRELRNSFFPIPFYCIAFLILIGLGYVFKSIKSIPLLFITIYGLVSFSLLHTLSIIPLILFIITISINHFIDMCRNVVHENGVESTSAVPRVNYLTYLFIAFPLDLISAFLRENGYLFYAGIVLCFSCAAFRTVTVRYNLKNQNEYVRAIITGGLVSFVIAFISFNLYQEPSVFGVGWMLFFPFSPQGIFILLTTFLSIVINVANRRRSDE